VRDPAFALRQRPRRMRRRKALRDLARETHLRPEQLVLPVFIRQDAWTPAAIPLMPRVRRLTPEEAASEAHRWVRAGLRGVILFGVPASKHPDGRGAWSAAGPVPKALRAIRQSEPELALAADVCLCEYASHGHCGVLRGREVDNDRSVEALARAALAYAQAGADIVAPSAMMDGQVGAIRSTLDAAGFSDTATLAYAAKHASSFYGPFRAAAGSAPSFGDRRSYQMDPANAREAMREVDLDLRQGADIIMIKPALPCLDLVRAARRRTDVPIAAFAVSGEYAMLEAAAAVGALDRISAVLETLTATRRAGADMLLTYHAQEAAGWLSRPQ
jgi:porphobilinogen synthase